MTDARKAEFARLASQIIEAKSRYDEADAAACKAHDAWSAADKLLAKAMADEGLYYITVSSANATLALNDEGNGVVVLLRHSLIVP